MELIYTVVGASLLLTGIFVGKRIAEKPTESIFQFPIPKFKKVDPVEEKKETEEEEKINKFYS